MIDELNNYTLEEFLDLDKEERDLYKTYGLHGKAINLNDKDPMQWQWAKVKQIQDLINQPLLKYDDLIEIIALGIEQDREAVMKLKWHQVFRFYNFIIKAIEAINEKEQQLMREPDARELNAGIEGYQQFGWFATLYRLAAGDPLKYDAIGEQPYSVIFATLLLRKVDDEFEKAMIKQNTQSNV